MSERPDLRLSAPEQQAFLDDVFAAGGLVAFAVHGADGYPAVGFASAERRDGAIVFVDAEPVDGADVCCIIERGETYADITAVVARGTVRDRQLPLDDVVSFEFAKLGRSM